VENVVLADELQSTPAATTVEHRVVYRRTPPPALFVVVFVSTEKPASFDVPAVKGRIWVADKWIRYLPELTRCERRPAADELAAWQVDIELSILALNREGPPKGGSLKVPQ